MSETTPNREPSSPDPWNAEPSLEEFLAPSPAPNKSKRMLVSVVAGVTVVAMVAGFLVFAFGWGTDDPTSSASQDTRALIASSPISDAAQRYVAAAGGGVAADYLASMCQQFTSQMGEIADQAPADPQMVVRAVSDIVIDGDTASAVVSIAPANSPDAMPRVNTLRFVNEDGWKFCGQYQ